MSLSQETMFELMAYADGELDAEATARVEALVQRDDEARAVVAAMGALGDVVRATALDRPEVPQADAIADEVMRAIEATREAEPPKPIPLDRARARGNRHVVTVALGVLAMAAAATLWIRSNEEPVPPQAKQDFATPPPQPEIAPLPGALAQASPPGPSTQAPANAASGQGAPGVEIDQVESSHNVSVFYLPSGAAAANVGGASSVVVWIGDDKGGH